MAGVTEHGIRYPDGASRAKNLGPELKTMAEDIDWYIGSYLSPTGPIRQIVIDVARDVIPQIIAEQNIIRAYPEGDVTVRPTGRRTLPAYWTAKNLVDPYGATYSDTYGGTWQGDLLYGGDLPVLDDAGKLAVSQIPDSMATVRYVDDKIADLGGTGDGVVRASRPSVSMKYPVFGARLAKARRAGDPVAVVFAGSSTTERQPGWIGYGFTDQMQGTYPVANNTDPQWSRTATFTIQRAAGMHFYNAGIGGKQANSYLTDAMCDRIATLSPALVVHMVGSNDFRWTRDLTDYKNLLRSRMEYIDSGAPASAPVQHLLIHAYHRLDEPPRPAVGTWAEFGNALRELADERGNTAFLDLSQAYAAVGVAHVGDSNPMNLIASDLIHQTPAGNTFMGDLVAADIIS